MFRSVGTRVCSTVFEAAYCSQHNGATTGLAMLTGTSIIGYALFRRFIPNTVYRGLHARSVGVLKDVSQILRYLIETPKSILLAASLGNVDAMKALFDKDPSLLQETDEHGNTAMHLAAFHGQVEAMEWLFNKDPSLVQESNLYEDTPMAIAVYKGHIDAMQLLFEKDPSVIGEEIGLGITYMHFAIAHGCKLRVMEWLVDKDRSLLQKACENGWPPMHWAVLSGHMRAVQWLFEQAPSLLPNTDRQGKTALQLAIEEKQGKIAAFLIEKG